MFINPVSYGSSAAGSSVATPQSFKGSEEKAPINMTIGAENSAKPAEKEKFKITPEKIKEKTDQFANNVDAFTDSIDKTTDSVTNAVTKTTGATALIGAAFSKIIPTPVKDFFATPQFVMKNGKEVLNEAGQKILLTRKGSDGIERVVRKFNAKNTLIVAGALLSVWGGYKLYKYIKNRPPKQPKPQDVQNPNEVNPKK